MSSIYGIVLFDVDGTLVSRGSVGVSAGVAAMSNAAQLMTGVPNLGKQINFAGATDLDVARQLLEKGGRPPNRKDCEILLGHYERSLVALIKPGDYITLGNPSLVVPRLGAAGFVVGLGTGNTRIGATLKLESAGIGHLFNTAHGGYGDDAANRAALLRVGVARCGPPGTPVFVVGDTPRDVAAAHAIGARCIGVPHGNHTARILKKAGADEVIERVDEKLLEVLIPN